VTHTYIKNRLAITAPLEVGHDTYGIPGVPTRPRRKRESPSRVLSDFTNGFWLPGGSEGRVADQPDWLFQQARREKN
jgi:hypothetical protein